MVNRSRNWEKDRKLICLEKDLYKEISIKKGKKQTYSQFIKGLMGIMLLFSILVCAVSAADTIDLKSGITQTEKTSVNFTEGKMTYTDKVSGIFVTTATKVDGVDLKATAIKVDEKGAYTFTDDKDVATFKYDYFENGTIKETITLKEDKELSFPVTVPEGYTLIPWFNGEFKVVESSMQDTMTGLVAKKPYGVDAAGRYVDMNYKLDKNVLTLNYSKQLEVFNKVSNSTEFVSITYPLTIDPTWAATGGCYTTFIGNRTIIMWNTTGYTTWTAPSGVTSIWYLVVAGGGAGGAGFASTVYSGAGGGAGGLLNGTTTNITSGVNYTIRVGEGGVYTYMYSGNNSMFSNITAIGGGYGAWTYAGVTSGADGGSGGGAYISTTVAGNGTTGQGYKGGYGNTSPLSGYGSGGGGGSSAVGNNATSNSTAATGGAGTPINITGTLTTFAKGGSGNIEVGFSGSVQPPVAGSVNTGDGGQGGRGNDGGRNGASGGSGIVIISYTQSSPTPAANFTSNVTTGNVPFTVQFYDNSTNVPTSWSWTFGDGNTSTLQNPTHTYVIAGTYNVSLTSNNTLITNTTTKNNYITASGGTPYAEFHANTTAGTSPLAVQFTDDTNASATAWNWTFGGANFSNSQNPVYTFSGVGRYNVSLNASSASGFNRTTKAYYINVTAALVNPSGYLNITPSPNSMYVTSTGTSQLNARNITAKFIYANITFNKSEVKIMSATNNFSVYPGLTVAPVYNNASGFVYMNISNSSGGNIIIGNTLTPVVDMNFYVLSNTNGSAPLNFASAQTMLTTGDIEAVNMTRGGVITTLDSYFTFTVNVLNAATNSKVNTLLTINTSGSNITPLYVQTSSGSYQFSANYSNVTFNVTCDGYYNLVQTVLIQNNDDVNLLITPLTGPGQSTWYSPHQVRMTVIDDVYGTRLVGATINITPLTNTFPIDGSADWLVNMYGINAGAANDMLNGTLIMSGVSAGDGSATFTMLSSIGYNINIKNDTTGINHNVKLYPIENDYNINVALYSFDTSTAILMNATELTYTAPNTTYGTFGLTYQDISALTTSVNFSVICRGNNTLMYTTTLSGFGADVAYANYTIKAVRGEQYIWRYNATRVV